MFKLSLSLLLIAVLAISISRRMRISSRYERSPKKLSPWTAMDKGIDPTEENQ